MNGDNRCIALTSWNGSAFETHAGLRISHTNLHGCVNLIWMYNVRDSEIEYTRFADSAALNSKIYHANVIVAAGCKNITFRYNEITNWQVEGIMWIFGGSSDWYVYGNLWHDGMGGQDGNTHRVLEAQDGVEGPIYFYNNTMANIHLSVRTANNGSYAAGSQGRNNIYWNTEGPGLPSDDYDMANFPLHEAHGISNATPPFVSYASQDYHLAHHTSSGCFLRSPFLADTDGNQRGAGGVWDRGAYQFQENPISVARNR
jgi:hypothetical protein